MQRFHGGSCTSAVNNSAHPGIQSRDTSRAETSPIPPNYALNSRRSSYLSPYKLKCDKEQLNSRLGPPDFHPPSPNCREETLTGAYVQSGYKEAVEGFEETREISLSQIQTFTKPVIARCKEAIKKCHRAINESRAQKRKAGQVYGVPLSGSLLNKPGVFPEQKACGEESRKKWIEGLSQPHKRLCSLADHVPHGFKKKSLFEVLIKDRIPLLRATWFIKVIYLNQVRASSLSAFHDKPQVSCSEKWTKDVIEYLQHLLDEFILKNQSQANVNFRDQSQVSFPVSVHSNEPSLYTKWWYMVRLVYWHHAEGLVVPSLMIDWIFNQLQEKGLLSVLQLLLPMIYGFAETVVSSQTYVCKLVGIAARFIHEPSPGRSNHVENSRHAYATSAVVEMLRFLVLAVPDTFVALDCFPMSVVCPTLSDENLFSKLLEDITKVNYGQVEVAGALRDRNYEVQAEMLSFNSVASSIQKRSETLSRASKSIYSGCNMAKTVQMLDQALLSGEVGALYDILFETCWDGFCAERWSADVSSCLLASLKHFGKISSSLLCSIFFICEWATCDYRDFRAEPPRGLKFTGRKDASQIFIAVRLFKQKMLNSFNFVGPDRKYTDISNIFESPSPLHDAIVCWIDQHEVYNGEGFKRLQLLVRELMLAGIFNPLAYGRQLIASGVMDGNGSMGEIEKQKRHYKLLKQLPASYIHEILLESQVSDPSVLIEATNIYSHERRMVLHGPIGESKSGARRQKNHHKLGSDTGSPAVSDWCFQTSSHQSRGNMDAVENLADIEASISALLKLPRPPSAPGNSGDASTCEECRRMKRQKLSEVQSTFLLNPVEDEEVWWVKKETKYMDSLKIEPPPKSLKQTPKGRLKSGIKTQSLAQLAAARIEGSQGASPSHVCEGRVRCPHHTTSHDDVTTSLDFTMRSNAGDIVSVGRILKHMRISEKRKLMAWLVSVVKKIIEEAEKTAAKVSLPNRFTPAAEDQVPSHWRLGEDELCAILYMMDSCNEFVATARLLFWLLPKVPGTSHIINRNPLMFPKTADCSTCDVGEAFLLSLVRSYENIIVAADLIPEMLSAIMQRVSMISATKSKLSGSASLHYARYLLKKYNNVASVVEWEKTFRSLCDKKLITELEPGRSLEGDLSFNLGVPNGVEDLDDYFRQKINSTRPSRVGMNMKEIVSRHVDEVLQFFYNKDVNVYGHGTSKNPTMDRSNDEYHVAHQIVIGLMECMKSTGGAAQEGDPSLVSSAVAAIVNNVGLAISRVQDFTSRSNHSNTPAGSLHLARHILRIHVSCLCILKNALGERQSRVFEVALAMEASSSLLQILSPGKFPRSQFHVNSHDANANLYMDGVNNSNKTHPARAAKIFASVSALIIGCILQGVACLDRMVALFKLKEGMDVVRNLKSNMNGSTSSAGALKVDNFLEVSLNWFRVLVGNCKTISDGLIVDLLGEASIVALWRMQRSLPVNLVFPPAYSIFAFVTWKPILDSMIGSREDFHRLHQSLAVSFVDAIKHMPFRDICFRDFHGLYDLIAADTLDRDFLSFVDSSGLDINLKVSALVPLRSRLFLDALLGCKIPELAVRLDVGSWTSGHGELKKQCGENARRLMCKLVDVLDTLQPAKFHWQWVEIRLLLNEQAVNEKIMENESSLSDAIRSISPHPDKMKASENESNFVQIILTRLLVRPDAAHLFSEAVHLLGKSLEDSMLSQAKWMLKGAEVLYGKKSIRQKIMNIASELKELSFKSQYWKPWGWCYATPTVANKSEKLKLEACILEEGEVVDEAAESGQVCRGNGPFDVEGLIVCQQHLTERALIELILPCLDQGYDDLQSNFANEMIKQMDNIEQYMNSVIHGISRVSTIASPSIGSPSNKNGSRKSGKSGSPIISRQMSSNADAVPPSPAALRASLALRVQFLLRLLPVVCSDREPSSRNMRYILASVVLRLLSSRVVYEETCHLVNTLPISSNRNLGFLKEVSKTSPLQWGECLFDSLLFVFHVLLSSYQPSGLKMKPESKSSDSIRGHFVFDREVADSMQADLDNMDLPEAVRWRIQAAMPIVLPSSGLSFSCQPPSLPPSALSCLQPRNQVTTVSSKAPSKNSRAATSMKAKPQGIPHEPEMELDQWTLLEDGAAFGQSSPKSTSNAGSDHANLKATHWLKGAVRVRRTDLTYIGVVDEDS